MAPISLADTVHAVTTTVESTLAPLANGAIAQQPVDPTAARRPAESVQVESPNLTYTDEALLARYTFHSTSVDKQVDGQGHVKYHARPVERQLEFKTGRKVPKTG